MGVKLADKLEQMNGQNYPLIDASAVEYKKQDGTTIRVDEALNSIESGGSLDLTNYQQKTDNTLNTTDKTIVGAINEIKRNVGIMINDDDEPTEETVYSAVKIEREFARKIELAHMIQDDIINGVRTYSSAKIERDFQQKTDNTLNTTDKTIVGAINEIKTSADGITVPTKVSELDNDSGFLTEHQDLTDYAKTTDLHDHDNKDVLDSLTESDDGKLQYKGTAIGGTGGVSTADAVEYVNDVISSNNVEEALNSIIDKIYYVAPQISSFTANPTGGVFEVGTTISAPITFVWDYNKDITTQSLTDCTLTDNTVRTAIYNSDITSNKTFTLTASDGENNISKSISYTFVNPYYVGVSDVDVLDETAIKALTKKVEVKGVKTISYTNSQNYMVFAYPSSYGTIKKVTDANGFDVTSSFKLSNVTVNSVNYNVYVSNKVTGAFKMTFSI